MSFVINKSARCEIFSVTNGGCTGLVGGSTAAAAAAAVAASVLSVDARAVRLAVADESGGSSACTSVDVPCSARTDESCCDCRVDDACRRFLLQSSAAARMMSPALYKVTVGALCVFVSC